jgi:peptidoglycan/LPS O-acetylase OafA/YrhL
MGHQKLISNSIKQNPGTDFATSIRAIAAISVFIAHAGVLQMLGDNFPSYISVIAKGITMLLAMGPVAFFISSGFVLTLSYKASNKNYFNYALRRYLRLTPLYFMVLFWLYLAKELSLEDLILRLFYLDAFYPPLFNRDPIGILWTISIEFWCALLIPVFIFLFKSINPFICLCLFFIFSTLGPEILIRLGIESLQAYKSIVSSIFYFALGVFLTSIKKTAANNNIWALVLTFSLSLTLSTIYSQIISPWWAICLLTTSYIGYEFSKSKIKNTNFLLLYLGNICYGIYLFHVPIIGYISELVPSEIVFAISFPLVVTISVIAWKYIESPFIKMLK